MQEYIVVEPPITWIECDEKKFNLRWHTLTERNNDVSKSVRYIDDRIRLLLHSFHVDKCYYHVAIENETNIISSQAYPIDFGITEGMVYVSIGLPIN